MPSSRKGKPLRKEEGDYIALMVLKVVQAIAAETVTVPCRCCRGSGVQTRWNDR